MIDTEVLAARRKGRLRFTMACLATLAAAPALAASTSSISTSAREPAAVPAETETNVFSDVRRYCTNIATAATDARFAWQTSRLTELETRVKARIQALDAKEAELRDWIEKREALERRAAEHLVGIYAKMRPETAATQLSALDDDMAAAVLGQLGLRQASAIFNEIAPERAAKLAGLIAANPAASAVSNNGEGKKL